MDQKQPKWETPALDIIPFSTEDVIRTSGGIATKTEGYGESTSLSDLFS